SRNDFMVSLVRRIRVKKDIHRPRGSEVTRLEHIIAEDNAYGNRLEYSRALLLIPPRIDISIGRQY
ncbi:MAG: hypothetical protein JSV55_11265, partial [Deltaproteobacteria bacterium]